jgi:GxxExxY protein
MLQYLIAQILGSFKTENEILLHLSIITEDMEMLYGNITHTIIGCAMKVHSTLGNGFQEVIYQRALAIEMAKQKLSFVREMEMTIWYDGIDIGTRRVDFFVADKIMVELKAIMELTGTHLAQCKNYLEAYSLPIGLLINFGSTSLDHKRIHNQKHPEIINLRQHL